MDDDAQLAEKDALAASCHSRVSKLTWVNECGLTL